MKPNRSIFRPDRGGFSLVEAVFSVGVLSFGFLSLAPLLAVGLTNARVSRENRACAQVASTLLEEAKQGTLAAGSFYVDANGASCAAAQATYGVQSTSAILANSALTRLSLRITPVGLPAAAKTYAEILPVQP